MEIRITDWRASRDVIRKIREEVFIKEQHVPPELEWDSHDIEAVHFLALEGRNPVGCARLMPSGKFGRMAVLREHRSHNWGSRLINAIEDYARHELKIREIRAAAQAHAIPFYQKNGFNVEAGFFDDAGIAHLNVYKAPGAPETNYVFNPGRDSNLYSLDDITSLVGWTEMMLAMRPRRAIIACSDLHHPLWWNHAALDAVRRFAAGSHRRRVKILIPSEMGGINRHPLLRLQQRLSSRISVRVSAEVRDDVLITGPWGLLELTSEMHGIATMGDASRVKKMEALYLPLTETGQRPKEARRLAL
ncbi:MAG: GNAT family N-acetyltransferase [Pseudomonadota bacterium]|nr:GNAT family N-acetyltransferase [Pseudomonadota bacterium]